MKEIYLDIQLDKEDSIDISEDENYSVGTIDIHIDEIIDLEIADIQQVSIKEFENKQAETYITYQSANW